MRNPGCQLENVPYTDIKFRPAVISDPSGGTRRRDLVFDLRPHSPGESAVMRYSSGFKTAPSHESKSIHSPKSEPQGSE